MPHTRHNPEELANAFPIAVRQDALTAISTLSENRFSSRWHTFSLQIGDEILALPQRIYYEPPVNETRSLNVVQAELLDCLFTRHHDGFVRQRHLTRIIRSQKPWIPCFVLPLVGEYVAEILQLIYENLTHLDRSLYAEFLHSNPSFLDLTEKRVLSYWDCYFRSIKKQDHPGFLIVDFLRSLTKSET